eukprot:gene5424-5413_t
MPGAIFLADADSAVTIYTVARNSDVERSSPLLGRWRLAMERAARAEAGTVQESGGGKKKLTREERTQRAAHRALRQRRRHRAGDAKQRAAEAEAADAAEQRGAAARGALRELRRRVSAGAQWSRNAE